MRWEVYSAQSSEFATPVSRRTAVWCQVCFRRKRCDKHAGQLSIELQQKRSTFCSSRRCGQSMHEGCEFGQWGRWRARASSTRTHVLSPQEMRIARERNMNVFIEQKCGLCSSRRCGYSRNAQTKKQKKSGQHSVCFATVIAVYNRTAVAFSLFAGS